MTRKAMGISIILSEGKWILQQFEISIMSTIVRAAS